MYTLTISEHREAGNKVFRWRAEDRQTGMVYGQVHWVHPELDKSFGSDGLTCPEYFKKFLGKEFTLGTLREYRHPTREASATREPEATAPAQGQ